VIEAKEDHRISKQARSAEQDCACRTLRVVIIFMQ
jgi:hypothetical protein